MPSHLTRHIFRRILANEPILHGECIRQRACSTASPSLRLSRRQNAAHGPAQQQRTFLNFNMFGKKKRDVKEADLDPGIEVMMHYTKMERMRARLPPVEEVAEALRAFFKSKTDRNQPIEDTQAQLAVQSFRYYLNGRSTDDDPDSLSGRGLVNQKLMKDATRALRRTLKATPSHVALGKELYHAYAHALPLSNHHMARKTLGAYVHVLSQAGNVQSALDVLVQYENRIASRNTSNQENEYDEDEEEAVHTRGATPTSTTSTDLAIARAWRTLLRGVADVGDEDQLIRTLDMLRSRGYAEHSGIPFSMLQFYVRTDDTEAVKYWFEQCWQAKNRPTTAGDISYLAYTLRCTLGYYLDRQKLEYGHQIVRQVMAENSPKPVWDAIFVWAAGTGKGADEIGRMFTVMESSNEGIVEQDQWRLPDITTINGLVEFATSRNDPYLAERFIALGKERGIQPDATTYVLQMKYRLKVNDVDGALIAYKNLQSMDLSTNEDVPAVNQLVVALCSSKRHDFDTIMNVVADLADRRARFEPLTVSTLSLLHLSRDEVHDVIDLLNTHSYRFSSTEREAIRTKIVDYCLDKATPVSRSWDGYTILRSIFDEMPRTQRTELMVSFFERQRPDMAANVFQGMRTHSRPDTIPTVDTYVAAFLGSAKLRDLESLEIIHNQLKLDFNIDTTTYLYNALIIGYTACGKPRRALDFWEDIVASKEGPTYNSIHIALRACEKAPFGDLKAQEMWAKLKRQNVELDQSLWASYVAALAGNGDNELAITTIEKADQNNEVEVDAFLLGSLFGGSSGQDPQAEIESWAKEKYPHVWAELEKVPMDTREDGMRYFRIDRSVTP
ncbi:Complex I intermediate-associated protein 84, mitochondrial [Fulvia fulva]|nr:Complex I intermediate-associated protein 84, mitochondrial [Fulvia fulva]KAK4614387.1 Complex I intermediate-associated protein 84, mitochondrial [Fulvia fulva]WPV19833.1 Complex I intermediate-associated protein 84, mitochondrial [Fulvia fulva]WPV35243.1 Complex I intermediate-associated protein 84, mitochondrial [Fulvia fulva]